MKFLKIFLIFSIVMILFCLNGCISTQAVNQISDGDKNGNLIKIEYMNQGPYVNLDDFNEFMVYNQSDKCITFPYDFGEKIYGNNNNKWIELKNIIIYKPLDPNKPLKDIILKPKGELFSNRNASFDISSDDINIKPEMELMVIIRGHFCDDENVIVEKTIPFKLNSISTSSPNSNSRSPA